MEKSCIRTGSPDQVVPGAILKDVILAMHRKKINVLSIIVWYLNKFKLIDFGANGHFLKNPASAPDHRIVSYLVSFESSSSRPCAAKKINIPSSVVRHLYNFESPNLEQNLKLIDSNENLPLECTSLGKWLSARVSFEAATSNFGQDRSYNYRLITRPHASYFLQHFHSNFIGPFKSADRSRDNLNPIQAIRTLVRPTRLGTFRGTQPSL